MHTYIRVVAAFILIIVAVFSVSASVSAERDREDRNTRVRNENTSIFNNVNTECNSGGNQSNGGSISTGDCGSSSIVESQANTTIIRCCTPTPSGKPGGSPTPTPPGNTSTPTPTDKPGDGGNGGIGGNGGNGSVGGASTNASVLGLTSTSGNNFASLLTLIPSLGAVLLGASLLRKHAK